MFNKVRVKRALYRWRLWRSSSYHRGHKAGYKKSIEDIPRDEAYHARLRKYYYSHVNDCLKNRCEICKKLEEKA